ncbi:hypothetical protein P691DRAFT_807692 [Macrolepiota fuliginosa MF-IS2]|uniref:Uncharacterized protein n=1 Tax=Macrolepiota fuliginosa MF-IS2 TaxID=1400762 RepID=A0A9P6BXP1_9AGAR|nr:hypothetical protein P691DRAFT_807692 [Macrolepiota fuliginosa MF-IS2]
MESRKFPVEEDNPSRTDGAPSPATPVPPEETERSTEEGEESQVAVSAILDEEKEGGISMGNDKESDAESSNVVDPKNEEGWPEFVGGQPRGNVSHPSGSGSKKGGALKPTR